MRSCRSSTGMTAMCVPPPQKNSPVRCADRPALLWCLAQIRCCAARCVACRCLGWCGCGGGWVSEVCGSDLTNVLQLWLVQSDRRISTGCLETGMCSRGLQPGQPLRVRSMPASTETQDRRCWSAAAATGPSPPASLPYSPYWPRTGLFCDFAKTYNCFCKCKDRLGPGGSVPPVVPLPCVGLVSIQGVH